MKQEQDKMREMTTAGKADTPTKKPYTRPEVVSESLFESAALGAGKLIDQFPITCSEISQS